MSGALFLGPLPCQTWKQEWNQLKLPFADCYCRSAFLQHDSYTDVEDVQVMIAVNMHCIVGVGESPETPEREKQDCDFLIQTEQYGDIVFMHRN